MMLDVPNGVSYDVLLPDQEFPPPVPYYGFMMHGGGVAKVVRSRFFFAVSPVIRQPGSFVPGLDIHLKVGFWWAAPKIPGRLLMEACADARRAGRIERVYQFHLLDSGEWELWTPLQRGTAGRVVYRPGRLSSLVGLEVHSHHEMPAYFSAQDDIDERDGGLVYGVIGRVDSPQIEIALRAGMYGSWLPVDPEEIFDEVFLRIRRCKNEKANV